MSADGLQRLVQRTIVAINGRATRQRQVERLPGARA